MNILGSFPWERGYEYPVQDLTKLGPIPLLDQWYMQSCRHVVLSNKGHLTSVLAKQHPNSVFHSLLTNEDVLLFYITTLYQFSNEVNAKHCMPKS